MSKATLRLLQPIIALHIIIVAGIIGYMLIEKASFLDSLFMTTISITTVGYGEVVPLSDAGKVFTIIMLITSWGIFAFAIARITQFVVNGEVNKYFKNRKLMKNISKLENHVILCGYGRNGQQAAQTLKAHHIPFIVIEKNEQLMLKELSERDDILHLEGDSTDDELLRIAGVERARALITTLPVDAENVFIVLSARSLNPKLKIISRSSEAATVPKLKKAGADNVIMPDWVGGTHMATLVSKPDVIEFIDFISGEQGQSINIESVAFNDLPEELKGKNIREIMEWKRTGVNCIGIKDPEGKFIINPPDDTQIISGMKIILLGSSHRAGLACRAGIHCSSCPEPLLIKDIKVQVNKQKLNIVCPTQMKHNSDKMTIAPMSSQPCSKPNVEPTPSVKVKVFLNFIPFVFRIR